MGMMKISNSKLQTPNEFSATRLAELGFGVVGLEFGVISVSTQ